MNRIIEPNRALLWLADRLAKPQWTLARTVVNGQLGTHLVRARSYPFGLTVAMTVDRPAKHAIHACLLLASTQQACDDALYLSDDRLWLLRRFPVILTEVELDLLFKQQQCVAALLAFREETRGAFHSFVGSYA